MYTSTTATAFGLNFFMDRHSSLYTCVFMQKIIIIKYKTEMKFLLSNLILHYLFLSYTCSYMHNVHQQFVDAQL